MKATIKKLITVSLVSVSQVALAFEGDYNCEGTGLRIGKNQAMYGMIEVKFCEKNGVQLLYASKCEGKDSTFMILFDEITHRMNLNINTESAKRNKTDSMWVSCKKVR
jgi:hypothetical protein